MRFAAEIKPFSPAGKAPGPHGKLPPRAGSLTDPRPDEHPQDLRWSAQAAATPGKHLQPRTARFSYASCFFQQHFLYFLPLPQSHGSFGPGLFEARLDCTAGNDIFVASNIA